MKRFKGIINKIWSYFLVHILKIEIKETRTFNNIKLTINRLEKGGNTYFSRSSYRESINPFYQLIQKLNKPDIVLDIGANYGFTSNIFANIFKESKVIAIEADKNLCKYIELNKQNNLADNLIILQAICDEKAEEVKNFSINPLYSQDNRVKGDSIFWKKIKTRTTSIDSILKNANPIRFAFIKIDTQGYEKSVFSGGKKYLQENTNWLIKTEFSPYSLEKQGTNAKEFLKYLINCYDVVDFQGEVSFKEDSIDYLFKNKLTISDVDSFISFIMKLDHKKIGWTDLLVKTKTA